MQNHTIIICCIIPSSQIFYSLLQLFCKLVNTLHITFEKYHLHARQVPVPLGSSYLTKSRFAFSVTLTTIAFVYSSLRWFEAFTCSCLRTHSFFVAHPCPPVCLQHPRPPDTFNIPLDALESC